MAELPEHLWEKIVDNLPPPPPKLAQTVVLSANVSYVNLNVSKGLCVEERDLLVFVRRPNKCKKHWMDHGTHWATTIDFDEVMDVCTSAVCLGYCFADQNSREAHKKYASSCNPRNAAALAAIDKEIAGTMVIMVKK
jgi:hypothetical protein